MMTLKHIDGGMDQTVIEVTEVRYLFQKSDSNEQRDRMVLHAETPKDPFPKLFHVGTAYLMNEAGKTIAKYVLGDIPIPTVEANPSTVGEGDDGQHVDG